jgi:hypothetical protein
MSFTINPKVPARLTSQPLSDAQSLAAQKAVIDLAQHIEQRAAGSRFPGRLRVHNLKAALQGSEQPIEVKRTRFLQNFFSNTNQVRKSSAYLKALLSAAYKDRVSAQDFEKIMAKVDKHIQHNSGVDGFGSRHFAKFVREFEAAPTVFKTAPQARFFDAETTTLLNARSIKGDGPNAKTWKQAFVDIRTGLTSKADDGEVSKLAEGAEGPVFALKIGNQDKVIKINTHHAPDAGAGFRKGDIAVAHARREMPHIVRPYMYWIKVEKADAPPQIYQVEPNQLKNFIHENQKMSQATGVPVELKLHGVEMSRASGDTLRNLTQNGGLPDAEVGRFASGLFLGMEEMASNRFVHHDIKPANVLYDPQNQSVRLIDLGGVVKLSKSKDNLMQTSESIGSPPFQAPAALQGRPHGTEVDRFSYAVTLLAALEPAIASAETIQHLCSYLGGKAQLQDNQGQASTFAPQEYLGEYLRALQVADPQAAGRLQARLQAQPMLERLIQQSFVASEGGVQGNAAWDVVHTECLPALGPSSKDTAYLNATLKRRYEDVNQPQLAALYTQVAHEEGFVHTLQEFGIKKLAAKIGSAITAASRVDGRPNARLVGHAEIAEAVKQNIRDFIQTKKAQLADLAQQPIDEDLKAIVRKEIFLQGEMKSDQLQTLIETAPKFKAMMEKAIAVGGKEAFIALVQLRHALGDKLDGGDFRDSLFSYCIEYCQKMNIDLVAVRDNLFSDQAQNFYAVFVNDDASDDNAYTRSVMAQYNDTDYRNLNTAMQTDMAFLHSFSAVLQGFMGVSEPQKLVVPAATNLSDSDRQLIMQQLYPLPPA